MIRDVTKNYGGRNGYVFLMRSFAKYLVNEAARMPGKSGRKTYFGKEIVLIKSQKSPNFSRSEICNRLILKSPTIDAFVFSL